MSTARFTAFRAGVIALAFAFVLLAAYACEAASPSRQTLENSITRVLNFIKDPGYVNPATRGPLRRQIEDEVYHIFDFQEFSARTVGQRWNTFTPQQKKNFPHKHNIILTTPEKEVKLGMTLNYIGSETEWETRTEISNKYREVTVDEILRRFMAL